MTKEQTLKIILVVSLVGILFSGFLSYQELFTGRCNFSFVSCGVNSEPIVGLPACVYGLFMYLVVFIVSFLGLRSQKR